MRRGETFPPRVQCASIEDPAQTAHSRSLIRVFVGRWGEGGGNGRSQGSKASSGGQRRFRSDCADAQADLSLRWAHM